MAVPEGYVALDLVGFTDKGTYSGAAVYMKNDLVHKDNVIWRCIADNTQGVPPAAGENWEKWIEGSAQMSGCTAVDTEGMIGAKNSVVVAQALIDAIADKVMNDLVAKTQIVNNLLATVTGNVLDATQGKVLDDKITQLNGDLTVLNAERGKAIYAADLMALSGTPIFLQWDANTRNTPYKAGLTTHENGFAFCFGEYSGWQTVLVFVQGGDKAYIHFCDGGTPSGWKTWNIE